MCFAKQCSNVFSGLPKAVELSHENYNSMLAGIVASGDFQSVVEDNNIEHPSMVWGLLGSKMNILAIFSIHQSIN